MTAFDYGSVDWDDVFQRLDAGPRGTLTRIADELQIDKSLLSKIYKKYKSVP